MAAGRDQNDETMSHEDTLVDGSHSRPKNGTGDTGTAGGGEAPATPAPLPNVRPSMEVGDTLHQRTGAISGIEPGTRLDEHYRVVGKLGEGAMGTVYEVEHLELGKHFAAKVVSPVFAADDQAVKRLRQEARAAGSINHENIVSVSHFGRTSSGQVFIVMELLRGQDLRGRLEASGEGTLLPAQEARALVDQIAAGLGAAHEAGITHRDLKPENVFLADRTGGGVIAKIVDFGISKTSHGDADLKLTQTGQIVGTPLYMAPEQTTDATIDRRADIYALGVMMYEVLTGQLPFSANNVFEVVLMHRNNAPIPPRELQPAIAPAVQAVVLRCLEKSPDDRFASAAALRSAWHDAWEDPSGDTAASAHEGAYAQRPTPRVEPRVQLPTAAKSRAVPVALAALVLAVAGGFMWSSREGGAAGDSLLMPAPITQAVPTEGATPATAPAPVPNNANSQPTPDMMPIARELPEVAAQANHVVNLQSRPTGAQVIIGGELRCKTPCDIEVPVGDTLKGVLEKSGRKPAHFDVSGETPSELRLTLPRIVRKAPSLAPR